MSHMLAYAALSLHSQLQRTTTFTSPTKITINAQHYSSNDLKTSCRSQNLLRRQRLASSTSLQSVNTSFRLLFTGAQLEPCNTPKQTESIASFTTTYFQDLTLTLLLSISSLRILNSSTYAITLSNIQTKHSNLSNLAKNPLSLQSESTGFIPEYYYKYQRQLQNSPRN